MKQLVCSVCIAGLWAPFSCHAEFPAPRAIPNLPLYRGGVADVIARGPDGSVFVYGNFISVDGSARQRLARISSEGTVVAGWAPQFDANGSVFDMVVDATGALFVGGTFTSIGGVARRNLAKIDGNTGVVDADWNPNPNDFNVRDLALGPNGSLFVAGNYTTIGGQSRRYLSKLSTTGAGNADPVWNPNTSFFAGFPTSIAVDASGNLYVGGGSSLETGGVVASCVAKLSGTGTGAAIAGFTSASFCGSAQVTLLSLGSGDALFGAFGINTGTIRKLSTTTGALDPDWAILTNRELLNITAGADGWLYLAGAFTSLGATPTDRLTRVSQATPANVDGTWSPGIIGNSVKDLAFGGPGTIEVGGDFRFIGGRDRLGIAQIDVDSATAFAARPDLQAPGSISSFVHLGDGTTVFGGGFNRVGSAYRSNLVKIHPDGAIDPTWNPAPNAGAKVMLDPNGRLLAIGSFTVIGGESRSNLAFIESTGAGNAITSMSAPTLDNGTIIGSTRDGNALFLGGTFTSIGGQARQRIAKLVFGPSGLGLDAAWTPTVDGPGPFGASPVVFDLLADQAGSIYIAGFFNQVSGQSRPAGVAKLSTTGAGALDPGWTTPAADIPLVEDVALDGSGGIVVAGQFSSIGGMTRQGFARFATATGALDPTWNNASTNTALGYAIAVDAFGRAYLGGDFFSLGGALRSGIARFDAAGTVMSDWNPGTSGGFPFNDVTWLALDGRGGIYVSGNFTTVGGQPRAGFALLPLSEPPTSSGLADRAIDEDTTTGPVAFVVGDAETPPDSLSVTASSSNATLLAAAGISIAGASADRTIALSPLPNASGTTNVTVRVTDSGGTYSDTTFTLLVAEVNDVPVLTVPSPQFFSEDSGTQQLQIGVGDVETPASALVVSATSSDLQLFPPGSIIPGSGGATRQLSITPAANRSGNAVVTITVTDASDGSVGGQFNVTVNPVPDAPVVAAPPTQTIAEDTSTGSIAFSVSDADSLAGSSIVATSPTNPALLDIGDVTLAYDSATGLGTLVATPKLNASGTATLSLVAEDADFLESAPALFTINVTPVNDIPTVSQPANIGAGFLEDSVRTVPFTVGDVETAPGALLVSARVLSTNNAALFGNGALVVTNGATPGARMLTLTPAANQSGQATVELEVEDAEQAKAQSVFTVRVTPVTDDPDLVVMVDDGRSTISPGATGTWTITARNDGIDTVSGVQLVHAPSAGIAIIGFTCAGANGGVCHAPSGNGALGTVSVQLAPGGTVTYVVNGSVTATSGAVSYSIEARPPTGLTDTQPGDNLHIDTTEVGHTVFADGFE